MDGDQRVLLGVATDSIEFAVRIPRLYCLAAFSALGCALVLLYLAFQINSALHKMQQDGVLEFSFLQQVDHNLDQLRANLMRFQLGSDGENADALRSDYITRFDVLYSSLFTVNSDWLDYVSDHKSAVQLIDDSRAFLARYEPMMENDIDLENDVLTRMSQETSVLSQRIYETAQIFSQRKIEARKKQTSRMDQFVRWFLIMGGLFILTFSVAILGCFYRSR